MDRKPSKRPRTRRRDPEQESTPPFATADPTDRERALPLPLVFCFLRLKQACSILLRATANLVVECPLCGRSLKNGLMSGHLDRCTGEPSTTTGARPDAGPSQAWSKLMSTSNGSRSGAGSNTKDGSRCAALDLCPEKRTLGRASILIMARGRSAAARRPTQEIWICQGSYPSDPTSTRNRRSWSRCSRWAQEVEQTKSQRSLLLKLTRPSLLRNPPRSTGLRTADRQPERTLARSQGDPPPTTASSVRHPLERERRPRSGASRSQDGQATPE